MHSASIDVGKILSDEVDDRNWSAYLKGDRGVFTRRAARLIGGTEAKALTAHYETDREFHDSVNRYVHDFEAMLRRIHAERDVGYGQIVHRSGAGDGARPLTRPSGKSPGRRG